MLKNWNIWGSWVREESDITKGLFALNVVCALGLGMFLGWIFFGEPLLLAQSARLGDIGSLIAAAGTWVVGYMAWQIASQAHDHNEASRREDDMREKRRDLKEIAILEGNLFLCIAMGNALSKFEDGTITELRTWIGVHRAVLRGVQWNRDVLVQLDQNVQNLYENFKVQEAGVNFALDQALEELRERNGNEALGASERTSIKAITDLGRVLASDARAVLNPVRDLRDALEA